MSTQIIVDNDLATVRYVSDKGYIYHTFHKPMGGQPFKDILNAGLDALIKNKAIKWLSDDRKNAEFAPPDIEFAVADWGPRAAEAGWKFWALIVPESVAGQMGMIEIVDVFAGMGVKVRVFTTVEDARTWLEEQ